MSLLSVFQWLQQTDFATALRESALVYPTVMATHLTGMALFGGMIFLTDLRILGIATRGDTIFVDGRELRLGVFPIGVDAENPVP